MTGLYVHIPFCKKKCHYCDFVVTPALAAPSRAVFWDAFEKEAAHHAPRFRGVAFDTVYLGGGTPSALEPAEFDAFIGILEKNFRWKDGAEITCEVNPGDTDQARVAAWKKAGVNRISFGAQSFHDETLKKTNRAHDAAAIGDSFGRLRAAGFSNINLDLILSLPGEPWGKARASLEQAVALGPEHISLYELSVEERTVFGKMHRQGTLGLPSEEEQYETLSNARRFLKEAGYRHYELLNYAKPGFESRHNRLYWANEDYLGLGLGAYSYFDGRRFKHSSSYERYLEKASLGDWTAEEEATLDAEGKDVESFLLALRLTDGADAARFGRVLERRRGELAGLREKGLLVEEGGKVRLSPKGQFFAETVFTALC